MSTLVLTIAHNGYDYAFLSCLRSHRRYCREHGYTYVAVTRPRLLPDPALSAWLKVPLVEHALLSGFDRVLFLDADCFVTRRAPAADALDSPSAEVQMAHGRSGRFNSGVIASRRGPRSEEFFARVMASMTEPVPDEDRAALKFENGNLIYVARTLGTVGVLDRRWNNTSQPGMDDYVRHFTGPLRPGYRHAPLSDRYLRAVRAVTASPRRQPDQRTAEFRASLERLSAQTVRRYPALTARSKPLGTAPRPGH